MKLKPILRILTGFVAAVMLGGVPRAFAYTALGGSSGYLGSPAALVAIGVIVLPLAAAPVMLLRARLSAAPSAG